LNLTLLIAFDVDIKKVTLMIDTEQLTACISMQEREFWLIEVLKMESKYRWIDRYKSQINSHCNETISNPFFFVITIDIV